MILLAVSVLSNGVADNPEDILGLSTIEVVERQQRDLTLYRFLVELGKQRRIKFENIGPLNH